MPKNLTIKAEGHFQEIISIDTHSSANLPLLAILRRIQVFFRKSPTLFSKNTNFERFEKSYYFSHILWQICYNLVIKKISRSEPDTSVRREVEHYQLASQPQNRRIWAI